MQQTLKAVATCRSTKSAHVATGHSKESVTVVTVCTVGRGIKSALIAVGRGTKSSTKSTVFIDGLTRSARLTAYNKIVHCVVNSFYHFIPSALSVMMFQQPYYATLVVL